MTAIGPYRVLRPLARGGMAEVFEVQDGASGERFALKLLMQKGTALPRFNREYEAMIRLNHPNIVRVFHYGFHDDMPWLTMELLSGTQLQAHVKALGRPGSEERTREVLRIGHDIARALDHIHRRGLVHRDLKSANVLVLPDGRVKLLDFGTARILDGLEQITKKNEFMGTIAYAAPEQIAGRPVDGRADLYSLGVLLYRMLTGVLPFTAEDPGTLARQQLSELPRPIRELAQMPEALAALVHDLLAKEADLRPMTGGQVADALESIAGGPLGLPGTLDIAETERPVGRAEELSRLRELVLEGGVAVCLGGPFSGLGPAIDTLQAELQGRCALVDADGAIEPGAGIAAALTKGKVAPDADPVDAAIAAILALTGPPAVVIVRGVANSSVSRLEQLRAIRDGARPRARWLFIGTDISDLPDGPMQSLFPVAERVRFNRLDVRGVSLAVGALLQRRPPPGPVARDILAACGGQPELVEDVVRAMVDRGLLRALGRDENRLDWSVAGSETPLPERIRASVVALLDAMPADRRRFVEALALLGGEATYDTMALALDAPAQEVEFAAVGARLAGAVVIEQYVDGIVRVRLVPGPLLKLVLERMRPSRRRVIASRVVGPLLESAVNPALVRLLVDVGRPAEAVVRAIAWAEHHIAMNQPVTALEGIDAVIDRVDDVAVPAVDVARLHLAHASALILARPTDARIARSLQRAAMAATDPESTAQLLLTRARVQRVVGLYSHARTLLEEAWSALPRREGLSTLVGATVCVEIATGLHLAGTHIVSGDWWRRARVLATRGGHVTEIALADAGLARHTAAGGKIRVGERALERATEAAAERGDAVALAVLLPEWADLLRLQGRWSEALDWLGRWLPTQRHGENPSAYVRMLLAQAWCELDLCRLGAAQECVDELAATVRQGEHLHLRLEADLVSARIQFASDNVREAGNLFMSVHERAKAAELALLAELAKAWHAETQWALGRYADAEQRFDAAIERLVAIGDAPTLLYACAARVRAMSVSKDPDEMMKPVEALVDREPVFVIGVEWLLAQARFLRAVGASTAVPVADAKKTLARIEEGLNPTDRAAMRVHPWSRLLLSHSESA